MTARDTRSLREEHRRQTRAAIAQAAETLFAAHGFQAVTIGAIADTAGVSRQTVFNHFGNKEDLVFDRSPDIETALVAAAGVRSGEPGLVDACREANRSFWERMESLPDPRPRGGFFDLLHASPALQAYADQLNARTVRRVGGAIAARIDAEPADLRPQVMAGALVGVYTATFAAVQRHIVAGEHPRSFLPALLRRADDAYDLLAPVIALGMR